MNPAQREEWRLEYSRTLPICSTDSQCEVMWAAARRWVNQNAGFRLDILTDDYMETHRSANEADARLFARVEKQPVNPDAGEYAIAVTLGCHNFLGCVPDRHEAALAFNKFVNTAAGIDNATVQSGYEFQFTR